MFALGARCGNSARSVLHDTPNNGNPSGSQTGGSRWDPQGILRGSDAFSRDPLRRARDFAGEGRHFSRESVSSTVPLYNVKKETRTANPLESDDADVF